MITILKQCRANKTFLRCIITEKIGLHARTKQNAEVTSRNLEVFQEVKNSTLNLQAAWTHGTKQPPTSPQQNATLSLVFKVRLTSDGATAQ